MPFKSKAQRGYLYANNPKVAKTFAADTPKGKKLPKRSKKKAPKPRGSGWDTKSKWEGDDLGSGYQ